MSAPAALRDDVPGVDAGVADGDQAPAPHLALHHVQQEAELALLAPAVAAAPSERGENNQLLSRKEFVRDNLSH